MSGRGLIGRALTAAGVLLVLVIGFGTPATVHAAVPLPQATTATPSSSPKPSSSPSEADVDPGDDPADDDSASPAPDQSGTWMAVGGAAAVSVLAGLVVALRRR
ncbi:MAG: hypothetical protein QM582_00595 [Micropruina sp.]|uniref:hypothetical protein n=1 Tax=Micropruina sp. TaxID=2737536 RepID=UPI0039E5DA28